MSKSNPTVNSLLASIRNLLENAHKERAVLLSSLRKEMQAEWSGCERCRGRGWVVTWDTMDSMSGCYHDWDTCPECGGNPEGGLKPGVLNKYDKLHGIHHDPMCDDPRYVDAVEEIDSEIRRFKLRIAELEESCQLLQGKSVIVTRGRKVPKGTVGKIFWVGRCKFSGDQRVGIKDKDGQTHWVAGGYCEVVL